MRSEAPEEASGAEIVLVLTKQPNENITFNRNFSYFIGQQRRHSTKHRQQL